MGGVFSYANIQKLFQLTKFNTKNLFFNIFSGIFASLESFQITNNLLTKNFKKMTKKEFLEELDSMIDEEFSIVNLQSDDFNEELLKTLWKIKEMALEIDD